MFNSGVVRVHYWESQGVYFDQRGKPAYAPGHVAVEMRLTANNVIYASFWPKGNCPVNICQNGGEAHTHNLDTDNLIETKTGKVYTLLGLDIEAMVKAFERFQKNPKSWTVFGSGILRRPYQRNCAGLSLYLLEKGGIRSLVQSQNLFSSRLKILVGTLSSTILLTCVSLSVRRQILRLNKDPIPGAEAFAELKIHLLPTPIQSFANFIGILNGHVDNSEEAFNYIKETYNLVLEAQKLAIAHPNFPSTTLQSLWSIAESTRELLAKFSPIIQKNRTTTMPRLLHLYNDLESRIYWGASAAFAHIALSSGIIYFNIGLWAKTITPADVEAIVLRAIKNQSLNLGKK